MNVLYSYGRQGFLEGGINWASDTILCVLINTSLYTFSDEHQYLVDIPAAARVATSSPLTGKTTTDGIADAADVTFTSVSGAQCSAIVIYKQGAGESTSRLIAYLDTLTGLPISPDGSNISIAWDNTPSRKIFKL